MDGKSIRTHLAEFREALRKNEEEGVHLRAVVSALEGLAQLDATSPSETTTEPSLDRAGVKRAERESSGGTITLRNAVLAVLQEAKGEPMHTSVMWPLVQAKGIDSAAQDPERNVDSTAWSLSHMGLPVTKVHARTWRWTGDDDVEEGSPIASGEDDRQSESAEPSDFFVPHSPDTESQEHYGQ